jgi:hypothetical protein
MGIPIKYFIYALIIILLQVLVCKHITTGTALAPYMDVMIYPLLLLILPVNTPASLVVILAFFSGLSIDFFYDSPGVHTSALVFTGFMRKIILNVIEPRIGYAVDDTPLRVSPSDYWYYLYVSILLFMHLLFYYMVSYFSLSYILDILIKTISTFVVSMLLISLHGITWRALN